ncbi:ABC transporter substrate-binding protein [Phenylobacterium sp.]|jgi:peptide/nickel transport system substrate-binding protein|uniref:ABC transporter substrate-binding protein n=1 Tax=Phenylobacterium sp. TaxID=1871053 RepID=UPI002F95B9ED
MRIAAAFLAFVMLAACGPPRTGVVPPLSPADRPQYGGELNVGTAFVTLSALSWDPADWTWKSNHDTGNVREQLFAADLSKSTSRGGPYPYTLDAYIPEEALRGELAESWEWEGPLTMVVHLRRGVMWPDKPGVMKAREFDAHDVVFSYNYVDRSPKKIAEYFSHIERVEARDRHTVVFHMKNYTVEWAYRFGFGYYSGIVPREAANIDQRDWRNVTGTGPFRLDRYLQGSVQTFAKNPQYWGVETIGGAPRRLPFVDRVTYRIIKDEATYVTAIRTGKLDVLEAVRWAMAKHLQETTPELRWHRWLQPEGTIVSLRVDQKPFDDVRVRRALNMAIDKKRLVSELNEGQAELMAYPQHPEFGAYYQPLEEMPASVKELFVYDPAKARKLLAEAGYPNGFSTKMQVCTCTPTHLDLAAVITDYWAQVGVKVTIEPLEYGAFLSRMTTRTHGPAYLFTTGHVSPTSTLRKSFLTGQLWNPSMYSDPEVDRQIRGMVMIRDEAERVRVVRELTVKIMDDAPYIWLPTPYLYTAWWPWVRNYGGELRAGAVRPGPIYARIWIDHDLKERMGFE